MIFWQETCFVVLAGTKLLMKQQYLDFPAAMNFQKNFSLKLGERYDFKSYQSIINAILIF